MWQLDSLADSAALIVTELIANAARHTSCQEIRLTVGWPSAARVRIGVLDREPSRLPVCGRAEDDAESGRGLVLIDGLFAGTAVSPGLIRLPAHDLPV
ncbi:ATP-binding protein [Streptomyces chrestomyceticus]|uniref:ATP-binding protein n=1 Tax=Streptomyces chrestomyceticus TaxID=68185 RepID=UPI0033FB0E01